VNSVTEPSCLTHWQEQAAKYEELDLEITPPKQNLWMLQNAVGDVETLA
jgi:hypothetical protein